MVQVIAGLSQFQRSVAQVSADVKLGRALWVHGRCSAAIGVIAALYGNLIGDEFGIVPNPPNKG
jgi:hypothetical protein